MSKILRREINPDVKIVNAGKGVMDYVASDESVDSQREVIRAKGWRFNRMQRNAPFLDSHNDKSIRSVLGRVIDFRVEKDKLIERVQWAIDVPENDLARIGFKMAEAGYLRAVSVGFIPLQSVGRFDAGFKKHLREMGIDESGPVHTIWLEQEQTELSAVAVGSNMNAVAKAYKDGALSDEDLERFADKSVRIERPAGRWPAEWKRVWLNGCRQRFLNQLHLTVRGL